MELPVPDRGLDEILIDMIRAFAAKARSQAAPVELEVWPNMVHDFQGFGTTVPQSTTAWHRLAEVLKRAFAPPVIAPSTGGIRK